MESRIIFESDKTYLPGIHWIKPENKSESEWCYLNPENITENDTEKILRENFSGDNVYIVTSRNESVEIKKVDVFSKIKTLYGQLEFRIWDSNFENVLEFKTEVYRKGRACR